MQQKREKKAEKETKYIKVQLRETFFDLAVYTVVSTFQVFEGGL